MSFLLKANSQSFSSEIDLPISKSIANRMLMLKALCKTEVDSIEEAPNDVHIFHKALITGKDEIDIQDAGTAMRFATAFYSLEKGSKKIFGTQRMHQRPIHPLVDALIEWGADIQYLEEEGYPPLEIRGQELHGGIIKIDAGISSQFISALLMIAPLCKSTCTIVLEGVQASRPYIDMTIKMMQLFGVEVDQYKNEFKIFPAKYKDFNLKIEKDWSAASFYYLLCALSKECVFHFPGLVSDSIQGDKSLKDIFRPLGVSTMEEKGVLYIKKMADREGHIDVIDFSNHPDLFLPVITAYAGLGKDIQFEGLYNLHLKESNRLEAMIYNLKQINAILSISGNTGSLITSVLPERASFRSFDDHRIAMSMAMMSVVLKEVELDQIDVVAKSFPNFWKEMKALEFDIE